MTQYATERRLYISENGVEFFKILKVSQGSKEGDLYFTWPNSLGTAFKIMDPSRPSGLVLHRANTDGKLSIHASGQMHFGPHSGKAADETVVKGNLLMNGRSMGARHLFTLLFSNPTLFPDKGSAAFDRKTDSTFITGGLAPGVIILFAMPNGCELDLNLRLPLDSFKLPGELPAIGYFTMKYHSLLWIAYHQRILHWPQSNQVAYTDGNLVPLFVGKEKK